MAKGIKGRAFLDTEDARECLSAVHFTTAGRKRVASGPPTTDESPTEKQDTTNEASENDLTNEDEASAGRDPGSTSPKAASSGHQDAEMPDAHNLDKYEDIDEDDDGEETVSPTADKSKRSAEKDKQSVTVKTEKKPTMNASLMSAKLPFSAQVTSLPTNAFPFPVAILAAVIHGIKVMGEPA